MSFHKFTLAAPIYATTPVYIYIYIYIYIYKYIYIYIYIYEFRMNEYIYIHSVFTAKGMIFDEIYQFGCGVYLSSDTCRMRLADYLASRSQRVKELH